MTFKVEGCNPFYERLAEEAKSKVQKMLFLLANKYIKRVCDEFFTYVEGVSYFCVDQDVIPEVELLKRINVISEGREVKEADIMMALKEHRLSYLKVISNNQEEWSPQEETFRSFNERAISIRISLLVDQKFEMSQFLIERGR